MEEIKVPKLQEENYNTWSIRIRAALVQKNAWEAIDPGYGENMKDEEKTKNEKALTFLFLVVNDQYLDDIADCTRAKDAWTTLKDIHMKYGLLHTLQLMREFFNISLKLGESISSYLARLMDLHWKVACSGHCIANREVALVMLMGLPKQYEGLILNLKRDENDLSMKVVKSRLIVEEKKLNRYTLEEEHRNIVNERALKTKEERKKHIFEASKGNFRGNERKVRCFSCGTWGHIARNCYGLKSKAQAKMSSHEDHQALCVTGCQEKQNHVWYLDSGATEHMCSTREKFQNLKIASSNVELANSEKIKVQGIGDVILKLGESYSKQSFFLKDVLFVPELEGNLLSIGRIEEMGMTVIFEKGKVTIKNQNKNVLIGYRHGRLYRIEERMHVTYVTKSEELLHRRLGHFHMAAIKKLNKRDTPDTNAEYISEGNTCSMCILGKMKKLPFSKSKTKRASKPLQLIHSDVVGSIQPVSRGGSRYIVTFVDDYSRFVTVKLMKSKSEVFEKFKEYKANVENFH